MRGPDRQEDRRVSEFGGIDGLFNAAAELSPSTIGRAWTRWRWIRPPGGARSR